MKSTTDALIDRFIINVPAPVAAFNVVAGIVSLATVVVALLGLAAGGIRPDMAAAMVSVASLVISLVNALTSITGRQS